MVDEPFKQQAVGMYNRAAHLYGQVGIKQFAYFANFLVQSLPVSEAARVLDVASGRGAVLFAAAEKVGTSGRVIGIDLAPAMVKQTQNEIRHRGLAQAQVCLMDADEVGFCANSFDFILCGYALHFLDYNMALLKFHNLLKPGGCFAAIQPYMSYDKDTLARWGWLFELTKAVFPPDFTPPPAWIAPRRLGTPELAEGAFKQAGFVDVRTEVHETVLFFRDEADWWDWEWSQGSRFWLEGMSAEGLQHFQQESFKHLREMKEPQGIGMKDGALFAIGYKRI